MSFKSSLVFVFIILASLFMICVDWGLFSKNKTSQTVSQDTLVERPAFYPIEFLNTEITDSKTSVVFAYGFKLFEIDLSTGVTKELYNFGYPINGINKIFGKEDLIVRVDKGIGAAYTTYWYYSNGVATQISLPEEAPALQDFQRLADRFTSNKVVYTTELENDGLQFKAFNFADSSTTEEGAFSTSIYPQALDNSYIPKLLVFSPGEEFIMSLRTDQGGGYGSPAYLYELGRTLRVPFDFSWYVSSVVWLNSTTMFGIYDGVPSLYTTNTTLPVSKQLVNAEQFKSANIEPFVTQDDVSPDGKYIAFVGRQPVKGLVSLYLYNVAEDTLQAIDSEGVKSQVFWSSDSQHLFYTEKNGDIDSLFMYDLTTSVMSELMQYPHNYFEKSVFNATIFSSKSIVAF